MDFKFFFLNQITIFIFQSYDICKKCFGTKYVLYTDRACCVDCPDDLVQTHYSNYCLVGSDCDLNCKKCEDFQRCKTCNDGYFLLPKEKRCHPCPSSCTKCSSLNVCTICQIDNFLLGDICTPCGNCEGTNEEGQSNAGKL